MNTINQIPTLSDDEQSVLDEAVQKINEYYTQEALYRKALVSYNKGNKDVHSMMKTGHALDEFCDAEKALRKYLLSMPTKLQTLLLSMGYDIVSEILTTTVG
jgi:hypothetical protein